MATTRAVRARLTAGVAAAALAAVLVLGLDTGGSLGGLVAMLGWAGVGVAVAGVVGAWPQLGPVAALLVGAAFCVTRFEEPGALDARVVPLAAALLLLAELVAWSCEAQTAAPPGVPAPTRLAVLGITVAVGGGVTALVAAVVTAPIHDDLAVAALGGAALALVTVVGVGLARGATR
jgi:hypothetical protein